MDSYLIPKESIIGLKIYVDTQKYIYIYIYLFTGILYEFPGICNTVASKLIYSTASYVLLLLSKVDINRLDGA